MIRSESHLQKYQPPESEAEMMRLKRGRWYAAFKCRGNFVGVSLDAYEAEKSKAARNLGRIFEQIERGNEPGKINRQIKSVEGEYRDSLKTRTQKTAERCDQILRLHLLPFFGEMTFQDVTTETVIEYKEKREKAGAKGDTLKREFREFRNLVCIGNPHFTIQSSSKDVRMRPVNSAKKESNIPSLSQILAVAEKLSQCPGQQSAAYKVIFLIQAYTAFRAGTAINLRRCEVDLVGGWIDTLQSKVGQRVKVPICKSLEKILKALPQPLTPGGKYFPDVSANNYNVSVRRAFRLFKIEASSKSLRHYAASALYNAGFDTTMVGKILGHASGSRITGVYIHPDERNIQSAFLALDEVSVA